MAEIKMIACDSTDCTIVDRKEENQNMPYGWFSVIIKQIGIGGDPFSFEGDEPQHGKRREFCSVKCIRHSLIEEYARG